VDAIADNEHEIGFIECPTSVFHPQCHDLLSAVHQRAAQRDRTCTAITISPLDHGGLQTRDRVFFNITRKDVQHEYGPFPSIRPTGQANATLRDILEPVGDLDLDMLCTTKHFVDRPQYSHRPRQANASYYTGTHGDHSYSYDLDGLAPTLTTGPTVVYDDCIGEHRKMSVREMLRVQGMPETFTFPPNTTHAEATRFIGKGMDGFAIKALARAVEEYILPTQQTANTPSAFFITPLQVHENHGHMSKDKSKVKGIPFPREGCLMCPYGKQKNSPATGKCRPKAKEPLDEVYCDIKVCSCADRNGIANVIGFVDSATNMSWVFPIATTSTACVIKAMDELRTQHLGGRRIKKIIMDNGSCFTSTAMKDYLVSINTERLFSAAYHQHQNGPAESLWNRLTPLVIIQMLQSPQLGMDYWYESMKHANDQIVRTPSRPHGNRTPYSLFHNLDTEPDFSWQKKWGAACYVKNHNKAKITHVPGESPTMALRCTKGYLVNYAEAHCNGTYDVV